MRFLAVLTAMGLNKQPVIKDYWSRSPVIYSPWFGQMFPRDRFEATYHSILHASAIDAKSKGKIGPFINTLIGTIE